MKALGIVFSARKRGNCLNCVDYVLTKLKEQGFETEVISAGQSSVLGTLIEDEKVKDRLDNLVSLVLKRWESKR